MSRYTAQQVEFIHKQCRDLDCDQCHCGACQGPRVAAVYARADDAELAAAQVEVNAAIARARVAEAAYFFASEVAGVAPQCPACAALLVGPCWRHRP